MLTSSPITSCGLPVTAYKIGIRARFGYSNSTEWGYYLQAIIAAQERGLITDATGRINITLNTIQTIQQTEGKNYQNLFYNYYQITETYSPGNDRNLSSISVTSSSPTAAVPSVDNALLFTSLLITEGWAKSKGYTSIETKAMNIKNRMKFDIFVFDSGANKYIAFDIKSGIRSTGKWDVYANEGGLAVWVAYISGSVTFDVYKTLISSMLRQSKSWTSPKSGQTYTVKEADWFNPMFTWSVRSIAGFPVNSVEAPLGSYSTDSFVNNIKAHIDYTDYLGIEWPAFSDAMSQSEGGVSLTGKYYPPNLNNQVPATTPKHLTPHAMFVPFNFIPDLPNTVVDTLIQKITSLKNDTTGYFHDSGTHAYGFEVTCSTKMNDTAYIGPDDRRPIFETLSEAYSVLSLFNGLQLNDGKPTFYNFASYVPGYSSTTIEVMEYIYPKVVSGCVTKSNGEGVPDVTINLSGNTTISYKALSNGYYLFTGLSDGNYLLTPSATNYTFVPTSATISVAGSSIRNQNFVEAYIPVISTYTISGYIKDNSSTAISGVNLILLGLTSSATVTNSSGYYEFLNISSGVYKVTPIKNNYTFSPDSMSYVNINSDQVNQNYWGNLQQVIIATYTISGYIKDNSSATINGVTISLTGLISSNTTTSASGYYEFINLSSGTYTVTPTSSGYVFNPPNKSYSLLNSNMTTQNFFGTVHYYIDGYIKDTSSTAIQGVNVTLSGDSSSVYITTNSGYYCFSNLVSGNYTVTPTTVGYTFSPINKSYSALSSNQTTQNFTGTVPTFYIKGYVKDISSNTIQGVTITLTGNSTGTYTTTGNGYYEFLNLATNNYIVNVTKNDYLFTISSKTYIGLSLNQDNQNFIGITKTINDSNVTIKNEVATNVIASNNTILSVSDVTSKINGSSIEIPADALTADTVITIGKVENPPVLPKTVKLQGSVVDFRAGNSASITFNTAATIKLPYSIDVVAPLKIQAVTYNPMTLIWDKVNIKNVDTVNRLIIFETLHLSYYGLVVNAAEDNLNKVVVYPNPGKIEIRFSNLSNPATIKIFTINGEFIKTIEETDGDGQTTWYTDSNSGEKVSSGIYIYIITNPQGQRINGKIGVIR